MGEYRHLMQELHLVYPPNPIINFQWKFVIRQRKKCVTNYFKNSAILSTLDFFFSRTQFVVKNT